MARKNSLPESLELLLDTMCNTFGGIMFIALALIILSQLVGKQMKDMTEEQYSEKAMARLEQMVKEQEQKLTALQLAIAKLKLPSGSSSPEKKALIRQFAAVQQKNIELKSQLEQTAVKVEAARQKLARLLLQEQRSMAELKKLKKKNEDEKAMNEELEKQLRKDVAMLKKQLEKTRPKSLRFALDQKTSLDAYFVLVCDSKIYRAGDQRIRNSDEVRWDQIDSRNLRLIPRRGTTLSSAPHVELNYLFRSVDHSRYFIYLCTDLDSYSTLLVLRRYLRNRGYQVYLEINPTFRFTLSATSYRASN